MKKLIVSIPRRGFSSLSRKMVGWLFHPIASRFNPPKGILFIVTNSPTGFWAVAVH